MFPNIRHVCCLIAGRAARWTNYLSLGTHELEEPTRCPDPEPEPHAEQSTRKHVSISCSCGANKNMRVANVLIAKIIRIRIERRTTLMCHKYICDVLTKM